MRVERERGLDVLVRDGPAERAASEVRQNLGGASRSRFVLALLWLLYGAPPLRVAAEDARAALGRLGNAGRVERADDLHAEEPRNIGHAFAGHERLEQIVALGEAARDERGADGCAGRL